MAIKFKIWVKAGSKDMHVEYRDDNDSGNDDNRDIDDGANWEFKAAPSDSDTNFGVGKVRAAEQKRDDNYTEGDYGKVRIIRPWKDANFELTDEDLP